MEWIYKAKPQHLSNAEDSTYYPIKYDPNAVQRRIDIYFILLLSHKLENKMLGEEGIVELDNSSEFFLCSLIIFRELGDSFHQILQFTHQNSLLVQLLINPLLRIFLKHAIHPEEL